MNPKLLKYYNRELQFMREMGAEFATEYPKIASRLGLDSFECADPYVERLLEGFSFLTARIQLKLDAEFPKFTQQLLEMLCPHYLAPTPSMVIVQLEPNLAEGALAKGYLVPKQTGLRAAMGKNQQTACEFRTVHDLKLWPLKLNEAHYVSDLSRLPQMGYRQSKTIKAGIILKFQTTTGIAVNQLPLDQLRLFLPGRDETSRKLYEQILSNAVALALRPSGSQGTAQILDPSHIRRVGFSDEDALLPYGPRSFQGYRLLQEYFAFPERYMFVEFAGLQQSLRTIPGKDWELIVLLDRHLPSLEKEVVASQFSLNCTPAINLFPKRADRIVLSDRENRYHVIPDRTRPLDFEVYGIQEVVGYGTSTDYKQTFLPFYALNNASHQDESAYFTLHREPTLLTSQQQKQGRRSSYAANEVFISLVDARENPVHPDLRQLGLDLLCTNRDLVLHMPTGSAGTSFSLESGAPVKAVHCLAGPTPPRASQVTGESAWRLINHLSLNYLSLVDDEGQQQGAAALRALLSLYGEMGEPAIVKQIEGLQSVRSQTITRRLPQPGPISYGRGLEISLTFNDMGFEGTGFFLLGSVLDHFFAKYVSINSFTQTVVKTIDRGEVVRWPIRAGRRQLV